MVMLAVEIKVWYPKVVGLPTRGAVMSFVGRQALVFLMKIYVPVVSQQ